MKKFAVTNIDIDYDEIQGEWRCLSKRQIKRAVYNFVYGYLNYEHLEELANENAQIKAYWHYGWDAPVVLVPSTQRWCDDLHDITEELERQTAIEKRRKIKCQN